MYEESAWQLKQWSDRYCVKKAQQLKQWSNEQCMKRARGTPYLTIPFSSAMCVENNSAEFERVHIPQEVTCQRFSPLAYALTGGII